MAISEVLQLKPVWWLTETDDKEREVGRDLKSRNHDTLQEMLGDIVTSIRWTRMHFSVHIITEYVIIRENIVLRRIESISLPSEQEGAAAIYVHGKVHI